MLTSLRAFALGLLLTGPMMTPATWNGSTCPVGSVTVAAVAYGANGDTQSATGTVTLPAVLVSLDFPNLYAQSYIIRANTSYPGGLTYQSEPVTVTGMVPMPAPSPTPTPIPQGQVVITAPAAQTTVSTSADTTVTVTFPAGTLNVQFDIAGRSWLRPYQAQIPSGVTSGSYDISLQTLTTVGAFPLTAKAVGGPADGQISAPVLIGVGGYVFPTPTPTPAPLPVLTSLTLGSATLTVGGTTQAVARDAAGQPMTVTWLASSPTVAAISPTGLVTALVEGTTIISASANGVTKSVTLTVVASLATLDTVAAQVAAVDAKVVTVGTNQVATDARLQNAFAAINVSFSQTITAAAAPKDLTPSALTAIEQAVARQLASALTPVVPPTCALTIASVQSPYANGDYRFTVRMPPGCKTPVSGANWWVIK